VSGISSRQPGTTAYLAKGDELSIRELLYGMMLMSGNDAATALAEGIGTFLHHEENESLDFIRNTNRIVVK